MSDTGTRSRLCYRFPAARLKRGHSFGNAQVYVTLDRNSDVIHEPRTNRLGMRDAWDQQYFLGGWQTELLAADGVRFEPTETTFLPDGQVTALRLNDLAVEKRFVLPFEHNHLRAAHYLYAASAPMSEAKLRTRVLLPAGTSVAAAVYRDHRYLEFRYVNGVAGVLWGSGPVGKFTTTVGPEHRVECTAEFEWPAGQECGLSFAYSHTAGPPVGVVHEQFAADSGQPASHLRRVKTLAEETALAVQRQLDTCRLWTPDAEITDGTHWAKLNQLRDWQEYRQGPGFSNSPPSDVVVGRDTFWFLVSTNYYAQAWSRRLLEFWFRDGIEPTGKFIEYVLASTSPMFRDDYGLNLNDNTPLLLISVHQYFSLTGDRGFLDAVYVAVRRAADYLLDQRNDAGLMFCRSRDHFVRGLCGWRNCTANYELTGAVTEINAECYRALAAVAELATVVGDRASTTRLRAAASDLRVAINRHLRSTAKERTHYLLAIARDGRRRDEETADQLFPALFGVSDPADSRAIVDDLFAEPYWRGTPDGAGGICTISPAQAGFEPKADPSTYGLQGGVWPNLALWAGRAAADAGRPDLVVQGLRATRRLADRPDFETANVTPGEFPEYFNADDLVQRGHPRSTFIHGSYLWTAWEGLLGITPHASGLEVNPQLPTGWNWTALSRVPYRGQSLTLLAVRAGRTLYTTVRVKSRWRQVVVSAARQDEFRLESDTPVFWLVAGREVLAASDTSAQARLIDRATGRVVASLTLAAGTLTKQKLRK